MRHMHCSGGQQSEIITAAKEKTNKRTKASESSAAGPMQKHKRILVNWKKKRLKEGKNIIRYNAVVVFVLQHKWFIHQVHAGLEKETGEC